ncbi:MAG: hypothetical protein D6795_01535 [Deltaproteobacteria bacterium]|nr:MAG: hypothetical protein D6795_01535 [Deltaproteobacteria bacterium]
MKVVVRPKVVVPKETPAPDEHPEWIVIPRGTDARPDLRVFLHTDALSEMVAYAYGDLTHERGGVVVGTYGRGKRGEFVAMDGFIPATRAISDRAALTFTHEAWEAIHRTIETEYPDRLILGWMHTHPGYGLFLSSHDRFIDTHFFSQAFRSAIVVDPTLSPYDAVAIFVWKGGGRERVRTGFTVYQEA